MKIADNAVETGNSHCLYYKSRMSILHGKFSGVFGRALVVGGMDKWRRNFKENFSRPNRALYYLAVRNLKNSNYCIYHPLQD